MIELINTDIVTVPVGQEVPFDETVVKSGCAEYHRNGASVIRLINPGRYLVTFSANIAVPTGETVGEVSLGILADGGILTGSIMRATPAAVEEYFNVYTQHYIDVPKCCGNVGTANVAVENTGDIPVLVDNANITVVRVAQGGVSYGKDEKTL